MKENAAIEIWLQGPIENVPVLLQPVAHALLQARKEVTEIMFDYDEKKLWEFPSGLASVAFHLQHLSGVLDRLFTYANDKQLSQYQLDILKAEGKFDKSLNSKILVQKFADQVDKSIEQIKEIKPETLENTRNVGRKQLPSTVTGLLFHAAEHTMRHVGQLLVTVALMK